MQTEVSEGSGKPERESGPAWKRDMQNLRPPRLASSVKNLFNFVLKLKVEANAPLFVSRVQIAKCQKGQLCQQHKALHLPNGDQQKGLCICICWEPHTLRLCSQPRFSGSLG